MISNDKKILIIENYYLFGCFEWECRFFYIGVNIWFFFFSWVKMSRKCDIDRGYMLLGVGLLDFILFFLFVVCGGWWCNYIVIC